MTDDLRIDCDDCVMQDTPVCGDCVVTYLCVPRPLGAVVIDVAEARALRLLNESGLLPGLRHRRRTG